MWMLWEKAMFALQIATNYVNAELPLRVEQLNNDIKVTWIWRNSLK